MDTHVEEMRTALSNLERAVEQLGRVILASGSAQTRLQFALSDAEDFRTRRDPADAPQELVRALARIQVPSGAELVEAVAAVNAAKAAARRALLAAAEVQPEPGSYARQVAEEVKEC